MAGVGERRIKKKGREEGRKKNIIMRNLGKICCGWCGRERGEKKGGERRENEEGRIKNIIMRNLGRNVAVGVGERGGRMKKKGEREEEEGRIKRKRGKNERGKIFYYLCWVCFFEGIFS